MQLLLANQVGDIYNSHVSIATADFAFIGSFKITEN